MSGKICIREGCGKPSRSKNLCDSHYKRLWKYGREEMVRSPRPSEYHGMSNTSDYRTYFNMLVRCNDETNNRYHRYGGRGIKVCERWANSFVNYFDDMGKKPLGMHLDRIDNDGDYSKENCRWSTAAENSQNTVKTKLTVENVVEIRSSEQSNRTLSLKYGVSEGYIRTVKNRQSWKNVE